MNDKAEWVTCSRCEGDCVVPDHDTGRLVGNQWIVEHTVECPSCKGKGQVRADVEAK